MAAKKKVESESVALVSEGVKRPRLHKLIIRNFRSIGVQPVEIELDDIVVLVGPNNAGKSSILRAYEIVMQQGSKEGRLILDDFPNCVVEAALPEVELQTIVFDNAPGERWIKTTETGEMLIRERWTWSSPNKDPTRQGFDVNKGDWDDQVPWGAPNVANSRRPVPHRIDAFAPPESQTAAIGALILELLKASLGKFKSDPSLDKSDYELVLDRIKELQANVVKATEVDLKKIEDEISGYLERIFPKHRVKINANPELEIEKTYSPFRASPDVLMGREGGHFSNLAHQGSGARRTLLWATLKYLSELRDTAESRPHVLLLDEPEICLHPSAIREARDVLYELPSAGSWQVMITSHSPLFIDLGKDNTTVVRVYRGEDSEVRSTTLFRPANARLSDDDKRNMKLLNICDPYLHEFFFGGAQVVVEGDTEYTAFAMLKEFYPEKYRDVQVIRARGKGVIPSVARVLLQFSKSFAILHDTDRPQTSSGKANPAWGMNKAIEEIQEYENASGAVHLVACKPDFEGALFGEEAKSDKPYAALVRLRQDEGARLRVASLLDCLLNPSLSPPQGCLRWKKLSELE